MDLWFFEGPPASDGRLDRIFNAVSMSCVTMRFAHMSDTLFLTPTPFQENTT